MPAGGEAATPWTGESVPIDAPIAGGSVARGLVRDGGRSASVDSLEQLARRGELQAARQDHDRFQAR